MAASRLRVDVVPEGHCSVPNTDKPGMIGLVGTILGSSGVNIVAMEVGRKNVGERAVMVISLEAPVEQEVLDKLNDQADLFGVKQVDLR